MVWDKGEAIERASTLGRQISPKLIDEGPHVMRFVLIQLTAIWLAAQTEPDDGDRYTDWANKLSELNNGAVMGAEFYLKKIAENEEEEDDKWPPQL